MAVESGVTGYSTTGAGDSHPKNAYPLLSTGGAPHFPQRRGLPRLPVRPVETGQAPSPHKVLGCDRITSRDSLLEGDRDVSPDLDG